MIHLPTPQVLAHNSQRLWRTSTICNSHASTTCLAGSRFSRRPGPVHTKLRSNSSPAASSALRALLLLLQNLLSHFNFLLILFYSNQTVSSQRQRRDIGRGYCDSKAVQVSIRQASKKQTNCLGVFLPSFFMSTASAILPLKPQLNYGL